MRKLHFNIKVKYSSSYGQSKLLDARYSILANALIPFGTLTSAFKLLFTSFLLIPLCLFSQPKIKKTRILFLMDASSSMTYPWNEGNNRFEVASNILLKIMDSVYSINNEIEFAVRAYGTMYPAQKLNCIDTKLEVPFNLQNTNQIKTRLKNLMPIGSSPIAYSLKKASENELSDAAIYDYSVIFITDGGESCNGDVCGIYQELLAKKITIKPYIIGLDKNENLKSYYACLGSYIEVSTAEDIEKAVKLILDANRPLIEKPKQLKLVTTYANEPPIKDTVKPVVIIKKDTVIPPPPPVIVKLETPVVERHINVYGRLKFQKLPKRKNEIVSINMSSRLLEKIKAVSLNFDVTEPQKTTPVFVSLLPNYSSLKLITVKPNIIAKKSNFKFPKKASLRFEYEEPKKTSPAFANLLPYYSIAKLKKVTAISIIAKKSNLKTIKKASLQFEYEEPKKVSPAFASLIPFYANIKLQSAKANMLAKKYSLKSNKKAIIRLAYDEPLKFLMAIINYINYPRRYSYANKLPDTKEMSFKIAQWKKQKAVLHFKVDEKKAVVKKDTISAPPSLPLGTSVEFTTKVEASKETMVQVYFKGNNGKTYPTAKPQILLQDAKTNQTVTSFNRDMNGAEPIPQKTVAGLYNLVIKGFDDLYAYNIEIKANTTTKVIIKVDDGTLQFRYQGNIKRPVNEYTAIVNRRFAAGATIKQKCSDILSYEPGTYYVEISSLPPGKHSIDISFGAIYEIQIPEPGILAIMNDKPMGKIQLQTQLGDQYVTFYTMNITGDQSKQTIELSSGLPLKIVYPVDPKMPQAGNKEIPFKVKPNNKLELELK